MIHTRGENAQKVCCMDILVMNLLQPVNPGRTPPSRLRHVGHTNHRRVGRVQTTGLQAEESSAVSIALQIPRRVSRVLKLTTTDDGSEASISSIRHSRSSARTVSSQNTLCTHSKVDKVHPIKSAHRHNDCSAHTMCTIKECTCQAGSSSSENLKFYRIMYTIEFVQQTG